MPSKPTTPSLYRLWRRGTIVSAQGREVGRGGEAVVREIGGDLLGKIFFHPTDQKRHKLEFLVRNTRDPRDPESIASHFSLPIDLICDGDSGKFAGYVMRRFVRGRPVQSLLHPDTRRADFPKLKPRHLPSIVANLWSGLMTAHNRGMIASDIQPSNLFVLENGEVAFIDIDAFQIEARGEFFPSGVGTPRYLPPELAREGLQQRREWWHDVFSAAAVSYEIMTLGSHIADGAVHGWHDPFPPENAERLSLGWWTFSDRATPIGQPHLEASDYQLDFALFGPELQELFRRCYDAGYVRPSDRPRPVEFRDAFLRLTRESRCCVSCGELAHRTAASCPWCKRAARLAA